MRLSSDDLDPAEWTALEAARHLVRTFDDAVRSHPDLMEPFVVMLADTPIDQQISIMRQGLRETVSKRF
jgi:hypothetical protein